MTVEDLFHRMTIKALLLRMTVDASFFSAAISASLIRIIICVLYSKRFVRSDRGIKQKKRNTGIYDYTYIALWDSFCLSTHGIQTCQQIYKFYQIPL